MAVDNTNITIGAPVALLGEMVLIGTAVGGVRNVSIAPSFDHFFVEGIEGVPGRHLAKRISENVTVSFDMFESTLENIRYWMDITNAAAGGTSAGGNTLEFGGDSVDPNERELVVKGTVPGGSNFVRTWTFDRAIATSPGEMAITDQDVTTLPSSWELLYDSTNSRLGEISDATA